MIILGLALVILGYIIPIPILTTIGIILILIGAVLLILGTTGQAIGGRRYWW